MSDIRRPRRSPGGAASREPKKVPALRIETICEDCDGDIMTPFSSVYPGINCLRKAFIANIPDIVLLKVSMHVIRNLPGQLTPYHIQTRDLQWRPISRISTGIWWLTWATLIDMHPAQGQEVLPPATYLPHRTTSSMCILTNNPTIIAGAEEPATLSGFFHPFQAAAGVAMAKMACTQHRLIFSEVVAEFGSRVGQR